MDCDQSLGYLHSKPVSAGEMVELLKTGRGSAIRPPEGSDTYQE
jgi:hypothetical protein